MDTLQSIIIFHHIVDKGSFTKAAEKLDISVAMASKHLRYLEHYLGVKLLNRSSRQISLTDIGRQYYMESTHAINTLEQARQQALNETVKPMGVLKMTMPIWVATPSFARLLAQYKKQYPDVVLSLYLENKHSDLVASGYDLALRVTDKLEENLIIKPITTIDFLWVASPEYLQGREMPKTKEDLKAHLGILPNYVQLHEPLQKSADCNDTSMLYQMALAGMGIAYLPEWLIKDDLHNGALYQLFSDQEKETLSLYAAYMNREYMSAKIRTMIDFLSENFNIS